MPTLRRLVNLLRVTENGQQNSARGEETAGGNNGTAQHYKVCIVCNLAEQICVANYGQLLYRRPLVHGEPTFYKAIKVIGFEFVRPQERIIELFSYRLSRINFEATTARARHTAILIQSTHIVVTIIIFYDTY